MKKTARNPKISFIFRIQNNSMPFALKIYFLKFLFYKIPKVVDPGRISTATSKIDPETTETNFPIPGCVCNPRTTPYLEKE